MKTVLLTLLVLYFGIPRGEAREHLFIVPARSNIAAKSPVFVDVYLYNEGSKAVQLPPLEYLVAEWLLNDTTGKRLGRSGELSRISSIRIANVAIRGGAVWHRRLELDVDAEPGDVVTVKVSLGRRPALKSNDLLLYCSPKSR